MSVKVVIRVIERRSVRLKRLGTKHGVVHDTFHAVAVTGAAGNAQQRACELEVSVASARGLETLVLVNQAGSQRASAWLTKKFVRAPAAGSEALRTHEHF